MNYQEGVKWQNKSELKAFWMCFLATQAEARPVHSESAVRKLEIISLFSMRARSRQPNRHP